MKRIFLALGLYACATAALAIVNLNTASKDELVALPGIGPAKAQAIVDYRTSHGGFKSIDELKDVKGIGAKRFEKLKGDLTLGAPHAGRGAAAAQKPGSPRAATGDVVAASAKKDVAKAKP